MCLARTTFMVGKSAMRRAAMLLAAVSLLVVGAAGCGGGDEDSSNTAQTHAALEGVYRGNASSSWEWAGFGGDRYALWKKGSVCNDDVATAPRECAETGTFSFDDAARTITFIDDATGVPQTFDASFGFVGSTSGSLTTKNLGGGDGLVDRNQETAKPASDRLVVADMSVVKKGLHIIFVACSLITGNPEPLPEPIPPPPITQPIAQGDGKCKK